MVRSIIVLLLFAIFFLTGTLYGMNQAVGGENEVKPKQEETEVIKQEQEPKNQKELHQNTKVVSADQVDVAEPVSFVQKAASLLEAVVKGFYEVLVQILHQISNLFF